jgi:ActR/RegA family two-component response regulator
VADGQQRPRVLFVDDEPSIRLTLPPVLQEAGFEVRVSESVPDALFEINTNPYDVLISDLNIGEDGDGFLVVSAMRHIQPGCTNFILTGYPAFETALQAIHNQVDDYLVKPVEVTSLIKAVREKFESRRSETVSRRLSVFLRENASKITETIETGMQQTGVADRHEIATLLTNLAGKLDLERDGLSAHALRSAAELGKRVKDQGETLTSLLAGFECFSDAVYTLIQTKVTTTDMMNMLSELRRFNRNVNRLMGRSVEAYLKRKVV